MMEASGMYPKGFHPSAKYLDLDVLFDAKYISRSKAKSVNYFFIDFEMSRIIKSGSDRHAGIQQGPSKLAPEIESGQPYDPFLADVYYLGNVYREYILEVCHLCRQNTLALNSCLKKYTNMEVFRPLVDSMIQEDPKFRPFASQALAQFTSIVLSCRGSSLRWRARPCQESRSSKTIGEIKSAGKEVLYVAATILLWPFRAVRSTVEALRRKQAIVLVDN